MVDTNPVVQHQPVQPNSTDFTSWQVLPAIPAQAQVYIDSGAGQPLGYNGPSNQGAGAIGIPPS